MDGGITEQEAENLRLRDEILKLLRVEADLFRKNGQLDAQGQIYRALADLGKRFNGRLSAEEIAAAVVQFVLYSLNIERAVVKLHEGARSRTLSLDGYYDEEQARAVAALSFAPDDPLFDGVASGEPCRLLPLPQGEAGRDAIGAAFMLDEYGLFPLRDERDAALIGYLVAGNTARKAPHHGRIIADGPVVLALQNVVELASVALRSARLNAAVEEERSRLEAKVLERTAELTEVNGRLTVELVERQRAEQERSALQDEIIRVQEERLAELTAPMLPITDQILVMPLIGTMDEARVRSVRWAALSGAAARRARYVILDVTGVRAVDASFAEALVRTASGLNLLGVRVIITGIRPEMARALVDLGLDLGTLVTHGTLESGFAHAMARAKKR